MTAVGAAPTAPRTDPVLEREHLTGQRCDVCGAHAVVATAHGLRADGTRKTLTWCNHHLRAFLVPLLAKGGFVLVDARTDAERSMRPAAS